MGEVTRAVSSVVGSAVGGKFGDQIKGAGAQAGKGIDASLGVPLFEGFEEAITGRRAKERALDAAKEATARADAAADTAWGRQQSEMEPWKEGALQGYKDLQSGAFFQKDPGYQFRLNEGNRAMNAGLAARGMANSGAALKALTRYGQDFASNEYQNAFNRQNSLINYGNQASMALGNFAGGHAANISNNALGYGNAQSAAHIGQANRGSQLLGGLLSAGATMYAGGGKMTR